MGVKTNRWGRHGWKVIETLACEADAQLANLQKNKQQALRRRVDRFFQTVFPYLLPCIYCEQSSVVFVRELLARRSNDSSYRNFVFQLRNRVNRKLGKRQYTWKEYEQEYRISKVSSYRFWNALFRFQSFILCDQSATRHVPAFVRFVTMMIQKPSLPLPSALLRAWSSRIDGVYRKTLPSGTCEEKVARWFDQMQPVLATTWPTSSSRLSKPNFVRTRLSAIVRRKKHLQEHV